jgi:transcription antitermination factor NusG
MEVVLSVGKGRWYALVVRPRHESAVERHLRNQGLNALSPTYQARRRWSDRVKVLELPLFAGYVFGHFSYEQRISVLNTPGVNSIVSFARTPQAIPDDEIEAIRSVIKSNLRVQPWPHIPVGEKVKVVDGCLAGLAGTLVREKDVCRVVVTIEILRRSVAVEVDRRNITSI